MQALGVTDGEFVWVGTARRSHGESRGLAQAVARQCLSSFHFKEAAANLLTIDAPDPTAKSRNLNSVPCVWRSVGEQPPYYCSTCWP